ESIGVLRRYTDLATLLDLLQRKAITLLPPSTWDDRNDRLMMETYREARGLKTLLALCLSSRSETYHHWKVFTQSSNGVCIHFHRKNFINTMKKSGIEVKAMKYLKFDELDSEKIQTVELPFLKRLAFRDEGEVRAIYENKNAERALKQVAIDLSIIERITLNPWMPKSVVESLGSIMNSLTNGTPIKISQSTLIESPTWRKFAAKYEKPELVQPLFRQPL
ncbi:MAG: hypothetical protein Q7V53_02590, partial [Caldisericota bacterium]|nr:hypothetical protein [Caldisericota bacterium]